MSTDEQATLDAYAGTSQPAEPSVIEADEPVERPAWAPGDAESDVDDAGTVHTCLTCGASITAQYARVFGDNEDRVYRCQNCGDREGNGRIAAGLDEVTTGVFR